MNFDSRFYHQSRLNSAASVPIDSVPSFVEVMLGLAGLVRYPCLYSESASSEALIYLYFQFAVENWLILSSN